MQLPGGCLPIAEGTAGCTDLYDPGLSWNCRPYSVGDTGRAGENGIYYKKRVRDGRSDSGGEEDRKEAVRERGVFSAVPDSDGDPKGDCGEGCDGG